MRKHDKGTVLRTVLLLLAFANQALAVFGKEKLPFSNEEATSFIDMLYSIGSFIFTGVIAGISWYKNNYVTKKGKAQKVVLVKEGLAKK
ncbi:phage holin [Peribacillus sp. B-H-3]|uniref:phage holin n=1 Tax=Peribacillus sp. B-H-3 TaxID=3400420 RepID=UPI003B021D80